MQFNPQTARFMSQLHPGVQLLLISGLTIFWLIPLSSWAMLGGQRDRNARLWFIGTGAYSVVATLFVFRSALPEWMNGPLAGTLSGVSVMCLLESMRLELHPKPTPWLVYGGLTGTWFVVLMTLRALGYQAVPAVHLSMLSALEIVLMAVTYRVLRQYKSRALWIVLLTFAAFWLINMSRVVEFVWTGRFSTLLEFTPIASIALVVNYLSAIFYCYGYWGFVVEKSRLRLVQATEETVLAREAERLAEERTRLAHEVLRERTALLDRLSKIGKMAQSGALSATIAHEVNQPLASVRLNVELAQSMAEDIQAPEALKRVLARTAEDNLRAATIVRRVRDMFRPGQAVKDDLVLDDLVRFVVDLMKKRLQDDHVQIQLVLEALGLFHFARGELEHVLMNLLDNALDAVTQVETGQRWIRVNTWREPGWLCIAVTDNGPGIAPDVQEHIFELSESSKEQGLGLGLWLSRYIAERHGGRLWLDARQETGTRFVLQLPEDSV